MLESPSEILNVQNTLLALYFILRMCVCVCNITYTVWSVSQDRRGVDTDVAHWHPVTEQGRNKYRGLQRRVSSDSVLNFGAKYCVGF